MHPGALTSDTGSHPSSVSLREPPSPARGEGRVGGAFPHAVRPRRLTARGDGEGAERRARSPAGKRFTVSASRDAPRGQFERKPGGGWPLSGLTVGASGGQGAPAAPSWTGPSIPLDPCRGSSRGDPPRLCKKWAYRSRRGRSLLEARKPSPRAPCDGRDPPHPTNPAPSAPAAASERRPSAPPPRRDGEMMGPLWTRARRSRGVRGSGVDLTGERGRGVAELRVGGRWNGGRAGPAQGAPEGVRPRPAPGAQPSPTADRARLAGITAHELPSAGIQVPYRPGT